MGITTTAMADPRVVVAMQQLGALLCSLTDNINLLSDFEEAQAVLSKTMLSVMEPRTVTTRRKFWVRPGRTSSWWDNFVNGLVVPHFITTTAAMADPRFVVVMQPLVALLCSLMENLLDQPPFCT